MSRKGLVTISLVLAVGCLLLGSSLLSAGATPRKMNGTWSSIIEIPANPVLGNTETVYMPELDTFSTSGTAITSSASPVMPLNVDSGPYLAAVEIGQGNWIFRGGRFFMTQWRFLTDTDTGDPLGYLKVLVEWSLVSRNAATGTYQVEMLQLDMTTPYEVDGSPVVVGGAFDMWRLGVERLP